MASLPVPSQRHGEEQVDLRPSKNLHTGSADGGRNQQVSNFALTGMINLSTEVSLHVMVIIRIRVTFSIFMGLISTYRIPAVNGDCLIFDDFYGGIIYK
jgi:hypothetical protein